MNAYEYLQQLREALSSLPDEEIDAAMRYYQDYFREAQDEAGAISDLGTPEQVAMDIISCYTGMMRKAPQFEQSEPLEGIPLDKNGKPHHKGIAPRTLVIFVVLGLVLAPLLIALGGAILGLGGAVISIVFVLAACLLLLPFALVLGGTIFTLFSFALWRMPPSALATLGLGLILIAGGVIAFLAVWKFVVRFFPPLLRRVVDALRTLIDKIISAVKRGAAK